MKNKFKSLVAGFLAAMMLFVSSCAQTNHNISTPLLERENLEEVMNSIAIVETPGDGLCSGIFVSENEVLTAAHCVQTTQTIIFMGFILEVPSDESPLGTEVGIITYDWYIEDRDLSETVSTPFVVVRYSEDADLALVRCSEDVCLDHDSIARISSRPSTRIGDTSVLIGHPAGLFYNVTTGIFSRAVEEMDGVNYIFSSSPIWFGNSGGPLFDRHGNLVGIASAMASTNGSPANQLGLYIHISTIREFLNGTTEFESEEDSEE